MKKFEVGGRNWSQRKLSRRLGLSRNKVAVPEGAAGSAQLRVFN